MDDPLQALREAATLAEKAAATRAVAERAGALRDAIARVLRKDDDGYRIDVLNAVGASGDASLADLAETLLDSASPPRVLRAAAITLGKLGFPGRSSGSRPCCTIAIPRHAPVRSPACSSSATRARSNLCAR